MRYFVISDTQGPVALVTHDYQRGSYVCRSLFDSFYSVFEACADRLGTKYVREAKGLRAEEYTAYEYEWVDDLLKNIMACGKHWFIESQGESSGSDLTIDDLVAEHLVN